MTEPWTCWKNMVLPISTALTCRPMSHQPCSKIWTLWNTSCVNPPRKMGMPAKNAFLITANGSRVFAKNSMCAACKMCVFKSGVCKIKWLWKNWHFVIFKKPKRLAYIESQRVEPFFTRVNIKNKKKGPNV